MHYGRERLAQACAAFAAALRAVPEHRTAALNLGIAAAQLGDLTTAARALRDAVTAHPDFTEAWLALADALRELRRPDAAGEACREALALDPSSAQAQIVLGQLAYEAGDLVAAEQHFRSAAAAAPERHEPPMNLGVLAKGRGHIDEALAQGRAAVALAPADPLAHFNLAMTALLAGDYAAGFAASEWRLRVPGAVDPYRDRLPLWHGESLDGGTLLVARDQGIGDFVLWSRLFSLARARGVRVAVECPPALVRLYTNVAGIDELIGGTCDPARLGAFAAHIPTCSLPAVLDLRAPDPSDVPYLHADAARTRAYRERFSRLGKARTIGLVWGGNPAYRLDRFRSPGLAAFGGLAEVADTAWVSLQKGPPERDLDDPPPGLEMLALGPELHDFAETAAAIAALDLVITMDTAVVHVAGALGRPVWVVLGFSHFWLWGIGAATSPWYPTVRLFRQTEPLSWHEPLAAIRAALN